MAGDDIKTAKTEPPSAGPALPARGKRRLLLLMPFLLLSAFILLAFFRITAQTGDEADDEIPNALQDKAAPRLKLPLLEAAANTALPAAGTKAATAAKQLFDSNNFKGRVTLVNFWGSWCPPCREEHPFLMSLADNPAFRLVGVNYKDSSDNAKRFLGNFGNPFSLIGFDKNGHAAIDWGVYGPPETFVLDKGGIILYRFIGPMNEAAFREKILPIITRANARQ
ncbi:MAG: DsbE family thiol:disulfide interchange protein [Candidatus Tokpelaia sp.]|nr:MAG: DsbE family thiol:disulfide interchange protein [Candidatus Tokpelaia sp.]KAA6207069.1 MAG: DsbE family thiol:disulfide interchange protein [Candidatus Tokpelaia sp.]